MKFSNIFNVIIAVVVIFVYLARPAPIFAHAAALDSASTPSQTIFSAATSAPCDTCPCPGEQGGDCCDTTYCSCTCHAPLNQGIRLVYAPDMVIHRYVERAWSLPQIYRSIFVPPQNFA